MLHSSFRLNNDRYSQSPIHNHRMKQFQDDGEVKVIKSTPRVHYNFWKLMSELSISLLNFTR